MRKEAIAIDRLIASKNGDRKIKQFIRIMDRLPTKIRRFEPFQPVQMNSAT